MRQFAICVGDLANVNNNTVVDATIQQYTASSHWMENSSVRVCVCILCEVQHTGTTTSVRTVLLKYEVCHCARSACAKSQFNESLLGCFIYRTGSVLCMVCLKKQYICCVSSLCMPWRASHHIAICKYLTRLVNRKCLLPHVRALVYVFRIK